MLFRKKYNRGMEIMRRKNEEYLKKQDPSLFSEEEGEEEDPKENKKFDSSQLEKNDLKAIIISAFLVFGPIILIMMAVLVLVWFLLH